MQNRKKLMGNILKVTVVALAAAILVAVVAIAVTFATGGFEIGGSDSSKDDGADRRAPVIKGPEGDTAIAYTGDTMTYKSLVTVSDNSGEYTLDVNSSSVNLNAVGTYKVVYTAKDPSGNESTYELTLVVKNGEYSEKKLMELVAAKATELGITQDMSKVEKVRRIYAYVNDPSESNKYNANIVFNDVSNIYNSQGSSFSRNNWQSDWVEEAILTLKNGKGDCYSYYSVSKAFFEYFEIENYGIKRAEDSSESGTHFWSIVNVGTESAPKWYFYDATRLAGKFESDGSRNACLITEGKLASYRTTADGTEFYKFEKWSGFPNIETEPLA